MLTETLILVSSVYSTLYVYISSHFEYTIKFKMFFEKGGQTRKRVRFIFIASNLLKFEKNCGQTM